VSGEPARVRLAVAAGLAGAVVALGGCGGGAEVGRADESWAEVRQRSAEAIDHAWAAAGGAEDPEVELRLVECPDSPGLGPGARFVLETRLAAPRPEGDEARMDRVEQALVERHGADRVEVAEVGQQTFVRWDDRAFSGNVGERPDALTAQVLSPCHEPPFAEFERFTAPDFDATAELERMRRGEHEPPEDGA
jgi:hypothetical protein